jgi:sugar phosphate isomerase/epimerase
MTPTEISMTTDYVTSYGSPEPYLRRIAAAGFTHLHWCHHWDTDFLYSQPEIAQISQWLAELDLQVLNIHASAGREKRWDSQVEYERQAGVELVRNRLEMAARLEADVIILHAAPYFPLEAQLKSLAELEPVARLLGVRIALENLGPGTFERLQELCTEFSPESVGLCYDTGHGNMLETKLDALEPLKERLIAVHIHDNDGSGDQHRIPFHGTVDWERFMRIVRQSPYNKPLNLETVRGETAEITEEAFLSEAYQASLRLMAMGN